MVEYSRALREKARDLSVDRHGFGVGGRTFEQIATIAGDRTWQAIGDSLLEKKSGLKSGTRAQPQDGAGSKEKIDGGFTGGGLGKQRGNGG